MSEIANSVHEILKALFPRYTIIPELYVNYRNTKLFFDFYIKEFNLYVEVQGQQHVKFNLHFHGTKERFLNQKKRDNLKIEYIQQDNTRSLVRFYYNEKISGAFVKEKINKALDRGFYE